ncbi:hypothetical protein ACFQ0T_29090 [Kitasatospora gansuensis]
MNDHDADNDLITVASWNIEHDGWESDGRGGGNLDRWYAAHEFLAGFGPFAAVARQEMTHSLNWRGRMAWQAGGALGGLIPFVHPTPTPASRNPTGLLLDTRAFWPVGEWPEDKTGGTAPPPSKPGLRAARRTRRRSCWPRCTCPRARPVPARSRRT